MPLVNDEARTQSISTPEPAVLIIILTYLWCWEGLGARGEGDNRGWDGWMASLTQWTWVWMNSGSWWWTGRPGVLQFMGSQRVRHDWATDLIWSDLWITWFPIFFCQKLDPMKITAYSSLLSTSLSLHKRERKQECMKESRENHIGERDRSKELRGT